MTRAVLVAMAALCALALAAPAGAASPSASVKPPAGGDITLAHLVFATKGGSGTPKLAVANRAKLSKQLTIAGGVRKLKKNSYLASIALIQRTGGGSGATPSFKLALPKGMKFSKFTSKQVGKNLLAAGGKAKWCATIPPDFAYVAKKLLAGSFLPRYPTAFEYVSAGYQLGCPSGYEERANLAAAIRGEPDPGAGSGSGEGSGPGSDEGEDEEGEGGPATSPTLQGSGSVAAEGGAYRYRMTFNEPVNGFVVEVGGTSIACPNQYDAGACGPHNSVSAGGVTLDCKGGYFSYEFECLSSSGGSARDRSAPPAVPANTEISGTFTINAGSVQAGRVKVVAYAQSGKSQPIVLSGP